MKKFFKILAYILLGFLLVICILLGYVKFALPNVGKAPVMKVELTPERIERGRYLANSVTVCMDCHSTRDWSKFAGPPLPGTTGKGGERFGPEFGFPGVYYSKNITPFGITRYTDGELFRVITTGVTKEGKALFPVMPYPYYGRMDPEDIKCIIAYIRTLRSIDYTVPESASKFPMNFIINLIPKKAEPHPKPPITDKLAYGAYMINAAGCAECHTQVNKGQIIPELKFSGGREFPFPNGAVVRSANLTPDKETGIGKWNEATFLALFKTYADSAYKAPSVGPNDFTSMMPWTMYGHMKTEDLSAIFAYLQTVKPIKNKVVKFSKAK
jgi:hypothetical protein